MEVVGPLAMLAPESPGAVGAGSSGYHRNNLIFTFGGGTNEIQRDIIGYLGLGLPGGRR